jgi:putative ABC transport system ATP-binding protein
VAIARALVTDPEIIFTDEPTGNLDSRSSLEIMSLLQQLNEKGRTIVLVTHEPDISEHARRIIRIADGRIISDEVNPEPRVAEQEMNALVSKEVSNENK